MTELEGADTPIHRAAREGDIAVLKKASKKELHREDKDGWIPLHWAAWKGNLEAIKTILTKGQVNNIEYRKQTVSLILIMLYIIVLDIVLYYGYTSRIDIDACNKLGRTALHIAAGYGQIRAIQLLTEAGANLYALDNRGQTPSLVGSDNGMRNCSHYLDTVAIRMQMHNPELVGRLKIKAYKDLQRRVKKGEKTRKSTKKRVASNIEYSTATEKCDKFRQRYHSESALRHHHSKKLSKQMNDLNNFVLRPATSADQLAEKHEMDTSSLKEDSQSVHLPSDTQTLPASFRPLKTNTSGMLESLNSLPDNLPQKKKSSSSVIPEMESFEGPTRRISAVSEVPANTHMGRSVSVSSRMSAATYSGYPQPVFSENDSPLTTFLQSLDITEVAQQLFDEKMDLDSLLLCEENDFSSIGLPLGPRKKLLAAIKVRRDTLTNPGKLQDTSL